MRPPSIAAFRSRVSRADVVEIANQKGPVDAGMESTGPFKSISQLMKSALSRFVPHRAMSTW
jgi:hypothetical protein